MILVHYWTEARPVYKGILLMILASFAFSCMDTIAKMMQEVCYDVRTEPHLLPVNANNFGTRVNTSEGARLDISACGLRSQFERTFYDVRVSHPNAASNVTLSLAEVYNKNEREKESAYGDRVREVEKGSFSPLVFLTTGGAGPHCTQVLKTLAHKIADKRKDLYSHVINHIRTRIRFSVLKSTLIALRG